MRKALGILGCALLLSFGAGTQARAADVIEQTSVVQSVPGPARVLDSWMQPTVVRTMTEIDENGQETVRHEPLVLERHERVMVPVSDLHEQTIVHKAPLVTTQSRVERKVAYKATSRSCYKPKRHVAHRQTVRRALAYNATASKTQSTGSSATIVEHHEQMETKPLIIERRDPALDLF